MPAAPYQSHLCPCLVAGRFSFQSARKAYASSPGGWRRARPVFPARDPPSDEASIRLHHSAGSGSASISPSPSNPTIRLTSFSRRDTYPSQYLRFPINLVINRYISFSCLSLIFPAFFHSYSGCTVLGFTRHKRHSTTKNVFHRYLPRLPSHPISTFAW